MEEKIFINRLILGDNLSQMKKMESESVDLIYLDPPFFSNRNYEVIWGDEGEVRSFQDRFSGGVEHYIAWLKERVLEMHRILKPTGSIYLHCDYHADAYIRVNILDKIFGAENFRNHIIWKRTNNPKGSQFEKRSIGIVTDSIFWYSKTLEYTFDETSIREQLQEEEIESKYLNCDDYGHFYIGPIIRSSSMGERPNLVYEYKGFIPEKWGWRMTKEKLIELDKKGDLGWSSNGKPYRKLRPINDKGNPIYNLWDDIKRIYYGNNERIGYPTQKPEALLERIIKASSNEGDIVFDPFCGGGTTLAVAVKLNRRWIGIDQSVAAIAVTEARLRGNRSVDFNKIRSTQKIKGRAIDANLFNPDSVVFTVEKYKYDYEELRYSEAFEFESFIVQQDGGYSNSKQRGDNGIDGHYPDRTPIQVKRSEKIVRDVVDRFRTAVERDLGKVEFQKCIEEKRRCGTIIAFSFGKGIIEEVARLKNQDGIIIDLKRVDEIVSIAKRPNVSINIEKAEKMEKGGKSFWRLEFSAHAGDSSIELFQWEVDVDEKSSGERVLNDRGGIYSFDFSEGEHKVCVKAITSDGITGEEVLKFHVNGKVEVEEKKEGKKV